MTDSLIQNDLNKFSDKVKTVTNWIYLKLKRLSLYILIILTSILATMLFLKDQMDTGSHIAHENNISISVNQKGELQCLNPKTGKIIIYDSALTKTIQVMLIPNNVK